MKENNDKNFVESPKIFCDECGFSGWIVAENLQSERNAFRCQCKNGQSLSARIMFWGQYLVGWTRISPKAAV